MNYYEHHLGDYLRDTAHLTMVEDGAYRRLLDAYYIKELPLPKAVRDIYRLVRAGSKVEKDAVSIVLGEFFSEGDDGWRHKRCDTEIARYQDKQAKAKRSAEARWGAPKPHSDGNANASKPHDAPDMRTHSDGNALQSPDTSSTPIPPRGAKAAVSLKTWAESVKAKGEKLIPEDDAVFDYAATVGIPDDFLSLAWQEFRYRYSQPDAKRYRDWRQVFRKAVRGNWLKLWYCDQHGAYALTTVGIQAQRALAEAA